MEIKTEMQSANFLPFFQKQERRTVLDLCFASSETSEPMNKRQFVLGLCIV